MNESEIVEQEDDLLVMSMAYRCGWIFALLEATDTVANVAADYLKASMAPATYFGPAIARLFPRESEAKQLADEQFINLIGQISYPPGWPERLTLAEQGEFAVGYWQHKGRMDVRVRLTPTQYGQMSQIEKRTWSAVISQAAREIKNAQAFLALEHAQRQQQEETRSHVVTFSVDLATIRHAERLNVKASRLLAVAVLTVITKDN